MTFQAIEAITNGLGNANGEILGVLVGAVGVLTIIPSLNALVGVFGLSQIIWFVWLGIVLLRSDPGKAA